MKNIFKLFGMVILLVGCNSSMEKEDEMKGELPPAVRVKQCEWDMSHDGVCIDIESGTRSASCMEESCFMEGARMKCWVGTEDGYGEILVCFSSGEVMCCCKNLEECPGL